MKRFRLIALLIVVVLVGFLFVVFGSSKKFTVSIDFENVSSVEVYDLTKDSSPIKSTPNPLQEEYELQNGPYKITYKGKGGFSDGSLSFDVDNEELNLRVSPPLEKSRLDSMLKEEKSVIHKTLSQAYPNIANEYEVQSGELFREGDWYGTTLKYKGQDIFNSDTLRVVLAKENGVWKIKSREPSIYLSIYNSPSVPRDVLIEINAL